MQDDARYAPTSTNYGTDPQICIGGTLTRRKFSTNMLYDLDVGIIVVGGSPDGSLVTIASKHGVLLGSVPTTVTGKIHFLFEKTG